jgi:hypothetical protein
MQAQFSGEIGPFLDTVQQRQVSVVVAASCKYANAGFSGSQAEFEQRVSAQMLRAIQETIAPKMANGQLSFKDLGTGNTGSLIPEIFARSGLGQAGIAVDRLVMHFGIDGRAPAPLPAPAPARSAVAPQQVDVRVGGFNAQASAGGGIDTAGLKNQLVDKAKSTLMWWAFGVGIVLLVLLAVGGYAFHVYRSTTTAATPAPAAGGATKGHTPAKK